MGGGGVRHLRIVRLETLFRALLDAPDRGISLLPQRVFPSKEREDKTMRDVIQIFIHGSTQLSTGN